MVGLVLGPIASAGDMVAITGMQMMLLLHIQAAYGKDPDVQRMWQLLPVIGGGFGWRMLARELSGFVPVAGIAIKGAIADVQVEARRASDNSYIGFLQWDHYADPTSPQHAQQFDYTSPMILDPGEMIILRHFANGYSSPALRAHHVLILWVK